MIQQIIFVITICLSAYFIRKRVLEIRGNIKLGREKTLQNNPRQRLMNMVLVAFGQKKMFKRFTPAILHFFIYAGFLIINLEVLEFVIDGLVGTHRVFAPYLGGLYNVLMNIFEGLALAVLLSCVIMLGRRNVLRIKRFWSAEMTSWPRLDANLILITEIVLMTAILTMNTADQVLQGRDAHYVATGNLFISGLFTPFMDSLSTPLLIVIERVAWWFHILGILGFAIYITYSKHLHIFLAFPNTYFADLEPKGQIANMPIVTREVKIMLGTINPDEATQGEPGRFGAKDINDLPWTSLLGAYACTECGRCTSECPANITGKKLSPRKIMMDTRDRMEEVRKSLKVGGPGLNDGKALLGNYITQEEINACTSCNACVEACPVMINPLEIIIEMRRFIAMEQSGAPASWNAMFQNIETNFAPWKFSPGDRFNWAKDIKK
ncbi:MAG: Fe-S oxidoreductase [Marivirga sp.]|nr:Fe-S oxidoreductase [Marivirga sp.]